MKGLNEVAGVWCAVSLGATLAVTGPATGQITLGSLVDAASSVGYPEGGGDTGGPFINVAPRCNDEQFKADGTDNEVTCLSDDSGAPPATGALAQGVGLQRSGVGGTLAQAFGGFQLIPDRPGVDVEADATGGVAVDEQVTLVSDTLSNGTRVTVTVDLLLSGAAGGLDNAGGSAQSEVSVAFGTISDLGGPLQDEDILGVGELFGQTGGDILPTDEFLSLDGGGTAYTGVYEGSYSFGADVGDTLQLILGMQSDAFAVGPNDSAVSSFVFTITDIRATLGSTSTPADVEFDGLLTNFFQPAAAELAGDYNASGLVEQGDLNLVLSNWGTAFDQVSASWINQRPTEGIVDQAELNAVLNNWGAAGAPEIGGVPEPAFAAPLVLFALRRRQTRKPRLDATA